MKDTYKLLSHTPKRLSNEGDSNVCNPNTTTLWTDPLTDQPNGEAVHTFYK